LQRLFSNFANGWPGFGLLLQRILAAILLVHFGVLAPTTRSLPSPMIAEIIGACAAILLLAGLFTPVVGALIAVIEVCVAVARIGDPWISVILATLGGTAAMIGPGAWSIDARLFGRKHLET
jgi:putative oxidoreductase